MSDDAQQDTLKYRELEVEEDTVREALTGILEICQENIEQKRPLGAGLTQAETDMVSMRLHASNPSTNDWVEEAQKKEETYFENASGDQIRLDLQKAHQDGTIQDLRGAVKIAANMLRRDSTSAGDASGEDGSGEETSAREEAAEELESAFTRFINSTDQSTN
jgi:hypothetical protein